MDKSDKRILRELAKKQHFYANSQENTEKIGRWYEHNQFRSQPMVLAEIFGIYDELNIEKELQCKDEKARQIELNIRRNLYQHEVIKDDSVLNDFYKIRWIIDEGNYGFPIKTKRAKDSHGKEWGMDIEAPIKNLKEQFHNLKKREFKVDKDRTYKEIEFLEDAFDGELEIRVRHEYWWTMGLTHHLIYLTGLQDYMMYLYDEPEYVHLLMDFLFDDKLGFVKWMEENRLLNMNNENDYIGSGTRGFDKNLIPDNDKVRSQNLWGLLESQPTASVSPSMFREFVMPYHLKMAKNFAYIYYGCCEPLHDRMDQIIQIPNLKTVAVSPFSDENIMSEYIRGHYIYSRKPNPLVISSTGFDEDEIRKSIRTTLEKTRGCEIEFIMKDLHTVNYQPERLVKWVEITKKEIAFNY